MSGSSEAAEKFLPKTALNLQNHTEITVKEELDLASIAGPL